MPCLSLRCSEAFDYFVLVEEGKDWRERFTSMVEALSYIEDRYQEKVDLTVLSESGTFLARFTIPDTAAESN